MQDTALKRFVDRLLKDLADPESEVYPGVQLVERTLEQAYGVSRVTVRTGLTLLEGVGLVRNTPYKGRFIRRYSPREIKDMYTVRALNEAYACRLAAEHATEEDLRELECLLIDLEEEEQRAYSRVREEKDYAFHRCVIAMSGNSALAELMEWSCLQFILLRVIEFQHGPARPMLVSHRDLFDAIRNRDAELAEALTRKHCWVQHRDEGA